MEDLTVFEICACGSVIHAYFLILIMCCYSEFVPLQHVVAWLAALSLTKMRWDIKCKINKGGQKRFLLLGWDSRAGCHLIYQIEVMVIFLIRQGF